MSEAMSSVEIEDVLSSIRRLVSEDLRPATRPAVQPDPETADKLILTPAFRVVAPSETVVAPPRPGPLPRLHLGAEPVARVVASSLERAVGAQSTEWESEVGDPPLFAAEMDWTEAGWAPPTAQVVQFTPTDAGAASWAQVDPGLPEPEASLPPPIAEPDRQWADQAEAEAVAALESDAPQDTVSAQPDPLNDELRLDEQILRDMVRDMIMAELQGTVGERMTRNVRKLVRAEIARAIALNQTE